MLAVCWLLFVVGCSLLGVCCLVLVVVSAAAVDNTYDRNEEDENSGDKYKP